MTYKTYLIALLAVVLITCVDSRNIYRRPYYRRFIRQTPFGVTVHGERGGKGPTQFGGGLGYKGDQFQAGVDANHVQGYGTDLSARAGANLWKSRDGSTSLDATANYDRHFGGPYGSGRANYGGFLNLSKRFGKK